MRVVITGFGVQSPLGCDFAESQETLARGTRCVGDIRNLDTRGYDIKAAGEIRRGGEPVLTPPGVDRKTEFFRRAMEELDAATGFTARYAPRERMLNLGGGMDYFDMDTLVRIPEFDFAALHHPMLAGIRAAAARWQMEGGCHIFSSACTASAQAMGLSYRLLKRGWHGAVVSGGSDAMVSHALYLGFRMLGALSDAHEPSEVLCKPFDAHARGTVLGEASVLLLLEEASRRDPKRPVYGEIVGYGCTMDAWSVTDPAPDGEQAAKAVQAALEDAGLTPDDIDCVHLHGTGTVKSAPAEYNCLLRVFGDRAREIPVYSMKGQTGHSIGACTAVEMLGVAYSLRHQVVLPTLNFETPHPDAPLHVVREKPLPLRIRHILKINSAFGGHNTALVIKKWEESS